MTHKLSPISVLKIKTQLRMKIVKNDKWQFVRSKRFPRKAWVKDASLKKIWGKRARWRHRSATWAWFESSNTLHRSV